MPHHIPVSTTSFQELNAAIQSHKKSACIVLEPKLFPILAKDCREMPLVLSNTNFTEQKTVALVVDGGEELTLDFNGAVLECQGQLQPLTLLDSRRVTVKNLTIDWKIPLSAEGVLLSMTHEEMVLRINPGLYPFQVEKNRLYFLGNGESAPLWPAAHTVFHPDTLAVCMGKGDELRLADCAALSENTVRFTGSFPTVYRPDSIVVLRHSQRIHAGIFVENCEDVRFENVTIHATGGLGILCQFNKNLAFDRVTFRANQAKGRLVVNGHDDGLHLTNNSGKIIVENCYFHGLMDDPINVHGLTTRIEEVMDPRTIRGRYIHEQSKGFALYARPGQEFSVIRSTSMHSLGTARAAEFTLLDQEHFLLRFDRDLPQDTRPGDALENLDNTAALDCQNNYFGSCRARGILVSTPKPVRIKNNLFQTAGSAILMAGDANYWYESGACRDVVISGNTFAAECMATPYEGCEAIISLCPVVPEPDDSLPFHHNITIKDNTFFTIGVPVVYAFSTEGLTVRKNRFFRCLGYGGAPNPPFILSHCCQVKIGENVFAGPWEYSC